MTTVKPGAGIWPVLLGVGILLLAMAPGVFGGSVISVPLGTIYRQLSDPTVVQLFEVNTPLALGHPLQVTVSLDDQNAGPENFLSATILQQSPPKSMVFNLPMQQPYVDFQLDREVVLGNCQSNSFTTSFCVDSDGAVVTVAITTIVSLNYSITFEVPTVLLALDQSVTIFPSLFQPSFVWFNVTQDVIDQGNTYFVKVNNTPQLTAMQMSIESGTCNGGQLVGVSAEYQSTTQTVSQQGLLSVDSYSEPPLAAGLWYVKFEVIAQNTGECTIVKNTTVTLGLNPSTLTYVAPIMLLVGVTLGGAVLYIVIWIINYSVVKMDDVSTFYFIQKNHKEELVVVGDGFFAFQNMEEKTIQGGRSTLHRVSTTQGALITEENLQSLSNDEIHELETITGGNPKVQVTETPSVPAGAMGLDLDEDTKQVDQTIPKLEPGGANPKRNTLVDKLDAKFEQMDQEAQRERATDANEDAIFAPKTKAATHPAADASGLRSRVAAAVAKPAPAGDEDKEKKTDGKPDDKPELKVQYHTADSRMQVVRRKMPDVEVSWTQQLTLDQLDTKGYDVVSNTSYRYFAMALTIATFYGVLAVQISVQAQVQFNRDGNSDICAYNFFCSGRYLAIRSFNNVMSNLSFLILGFLLLLITSFLSRLYWNQRCYAFYTVTGRQGSTKEVEDFTRDVAKCGVPQNFVIFYTISFLLILQGVFSGLYHLCPTNTMFQFDTTFMYAIAIHLAICLFQKRHPDATMEPIKGMFLVGLCIMIAVVGIYYDQSYSVWIAFIVLYVIFAAIFVLNFVFSGDWRQAPSFFYHFPQFMQVQKIELFILFGFMAFSNLGLAIASLVLWPSFATFLLGLLTSDFLIYLGYYILMKLRYDRGSRYYIWKPVILFFITIVFSLVAVYFFSIEVTDKNALAMLSRNANKDCVLLSFYDYHDIWHFFAALGLFFASLSLLYLDVDLNKVPRDKIHVF